MDQEALCGSNGPFVSTKHRLKSGLERRLATWNPEWSAGHQEPGVVSRTPGSFWSTWLASEDWAERNFSCLGHFKFQCRCLRATADDDDSVVTFFEDAPVESGS